MLRQRRKTDNVNIIREGDSVLATKASTVIDVSDKRIQELIESMFDIMYLEKGVGLAAPQINELKRIAVIDVENEKHVLINPIITKRSEEMVLFIEGCLSVPGKELPIIRHQNVTIKYMDVKGMECKLAATGFLSIVCQHEIDHLDGILITNRYEKQSQIRKSLNFTQQK